MPVETREVLKSYFEKDDTPTAEQFAALIDSLVHSKEDLALLVPPLGQPGHVLTRQLNGSAKWEDSGVVGAYQLAGKAMGVGSSAKTLAEYYSDKIAQLFAFYEQLRDRSFVSIVDFGAVPVASGPPGGAQVLTDCTEAIQSALNNADKKRVFVPAGRWLITAPLLIPDGVELFGEITPDGGESEIFCNESWAGGDMLTLESNTTLRTLFVNGAGYCDYNIKPGDSNNVLIKDCSAADATVAEINFFGQGLIEGGNYDRPPSDFGRPGACFELGGQVKVKDLNLDTLIHFGGSGSIEAYDVNMRTLNAGNKSKLVFWGGSVTQGVFLGSNSFEYGKFFGTKLAPAAAITLKNIPEVVELIGCV